MLCDSIPFQCKKVWVKTLSFYVGFYNDQHWCTFHPLFYHRNKVHPPLFMDLSDALRSLWLNITFSYCSPSALGNSLWAAFLPSHYFHCCPLPLTPSQYGHDLNITLKDDFLNICHECHISPFVCACPTLTLIECFRTPNAFALWCQTSILCSPLSHPLGSFHGFPRTSPYVLLEGLTVAHWMKSLVQQGARHEGWIWHLQRIGVSHLVKWE